MPDYQPGLAYQGIAQGLEAFGAAQEEQKTRAREFKALQEFADATGIAGKDQTTVMDLDTLKGFVRGAEGKRAMQEQQRKAQQEQAQFEETQKQHAAQRGQWASDTLFRGLSAYQDSRRLGLSERGTALAEQTHADVLAQRALQQREAEAQRGAVGGLVRDFNRFAEGPQFNGTGMARPMGQFEAYRQALGQNPRAITPQMVDDLGRMAVSEDRLNQPGAAPFAPSLGVQKVTLSDGTEVEMPVGRVGPNGAQFFPEFSPSNRKYTEKAGTAGARAARPMTDIERHRIVRDNEKDIADLAAKLTEVNADKSPKVSGAAYFQMRNQIKRKQDEIARLEDEAGGRSDAPGTSAPAAAPAQAAAQQVKLSGNPTADELDAAVQAVHMGAVLVKSHEEIEALPHGKVFVTKFGQVARKGTGPSATAPSASPAMPQVGEERRGYLYQGGDPSSPSSWKRKQ